MIVLVLLKREVKRIHCNCTAIFKTLYTACSKTSETKGPIYYTSSLDEIPNFGSTVICY